MIRNFRALVISVLACACTALPACAWAQQDGAPPGNTTPHNDSGKSAGTEGGAGAAGQSGTDPATLSRIEDQRIQKKNAQSGVQGASGSKATSKRRDWKD